MKNLIQNTLEKIEKERIAPEPRWKFSLRKSGLWVLLSFFLILGALSLSVAHYFFSSLDWDLYRFTNQSRLSYFLTVFPYLWAILLGLFLTAAFWDARKTETGYRFSRLKILLISLGSVLILGTAFAFSGAGDRFNSVLEKDLPYYRNHLVTTKEAQWNQPERGLLGGEIVSVSDVLLSLKDFSGNDWNVSLNEKTLIRPAAKVVSGETIKIIGEKKEGNNFEAEEIRPWAGRGMKNGQGRMMRPK